MNDGRMLVRDPDGEAPEVTEEGQKALNDIGAGLNESETNPIQQQRKVDTRFDQETGILYVNNKALSAEETNKFINLSKKEQLEQYGQPISVENKLNLANEQGGAKAVIESISTTASYDESGQSATVVLVSDNEGSSSTQSSSGGLVTVKSGGGKDDPYKKLYAG